MRIELYCNADSEQYREFAAKVFSENGITPDFRGRHQDMLDPEGAYERVIVLKDGGRIMGTVALRPLDRQFCICEVKRLYIVAEVQGNGWGSALMDTVLEYAKSRGYRFARLDTKERFKTAIKLIESRGFYQIGRYNQSNSDRFYEIDLSQVTARQPDSKRAGCSRILERPRS